MATPLWMNLHAKVAYWPLAVGNVIAHVYMYYGTPSVPFGTIVVGTILGIVAGAIVLVAIGPEPRKPETRE